MSCANGVPLATVRLQADGSVQLIPLSKQFVLDCIEAQGYDPVSVYVFSTDQSFGIGSRAISFQPPADPNKWKGYPVEPTNFGETIVTFQCGHKDKDTKAVLFNVIVDEVFKTAYLEFEHGNFRSGSRIPMEIQGLFDSCSKIGYSNEGLKVEGLLNNQEVAKPEVFSRFVIIDEHMIKFGIFSVSNLKGKTAILLKCVNVLEGKELLRLDLNLTVYEILEDDQGLKRQDCVESAGNALLKLPVIRFEHEPDFKWFEIPMYTLRRPDRITWTEQAGQTNRTLKLEQKHRDPRIFAGDMIYGAPDWLKVRYFFYVEGQIDPLPPHDVTAMILGSDNGTKRLDIKWLTSFYASCNPRISGYEVELHDNLGVGHYHTNKTQIIINIPKDCKPGIVSVTALSEFRRSKEARLLFTAQTEEKDDGLFPIP